MKSRLDGRQRLERMGFAPPRAFLRKPDPRGDTYGYYEARDVRADVDEKVRLFKRDQSGSPQWTCVFDSLTGLEAFMADYQAAIASPELSVRHLMPLIRTDEAWTAAEQAYAQARQAADDATAVLDAAKARLIELAGEQSQKGQMVQVIRSERKGSVQYAKAIAELLPDADLTNYTGKSSVVYTVKEVKA
jgi:hypothetical protein